MFRFITKQPFWVNALVAILFLVGLLFFVLWTLGFVTRHGKYEKVPAVTGMTYSEARSLLEGKGFSVEIMDSTWMEEEAKGKVLKQLPAADEMVKAKRTIYLTINRFQPPVIEMPNLVGLSFRNAELYLNQIGLKLLDTLRRPDIAKDAVLQQLYNGGEIKPGSKLYFGSGVTLVLGSGLGLEQMEVPVLIGMTYQEAKDLLESMGIHAGMPIADDDVRDTANAYVYKQSPEKKMALPTGGFQTNYIRAGQTIDLWVGTTKIAPPNEDSLLMEELKKLEEFSDN